MLLLLFLLLLTPLLLRLRLLLLRLLTTFLPFADCLLVCSLLSLGTSWFASLPRCPPALILLLTYQRCT
jgi:hypothetical protein